MYSYFLRPLRLTMFLALSALMLAGHAPAEDTKIQPDSETAEKIAQWIQQLDAKEFAARNEASRNLQNAGPAACPALAEAAVGESRESRMRALDILARHFQDGDPAAKEAAKQALDGIASSEHATAAKAKEILNPKPDPPPAAVPIFGVPQIQIRVNAIGGRRAQRIQINNGVKQIETEEGNRKIKITDDPNKGIEVEITDKKENGQQTTEKIQAKNADELKKKHPEAHKVYEKMQGQAGGIQIRAAAIPGGAFPVLPAQRAVPVQPPVASRRMALQMMQTSRRMLENSIRQLEQSKGDGDDAKKMDEALQRIKEIAKKLEQEEGKLAEN